MNGKGSDRRPETRPGMYAEGFERTWRGRKLSGVRTALKTAKEAVVVAGETYVITRPSWYGLNT